ncbi:MAG: peptidoglycan-binding domain-containing protein [Pseudomonadota bacterium]
MIFEGRRAAYGGSFAALSADPSLRRTHWDVSALIESRRARYTPPMGMIMGKRLPRTSATAGLVLAVLLMAAPQPASALSRDEIQQAQEALVALGHDAGTPDGVMGPQTRAALTAWERETGRVADGVLSRDDLDALTEPAVEVQAAEPVLAGSRAGARAAGETGLPGALRAPASLSDRRHQSAPGAGEDRRTPFGLTPPSESDLGAPAGDRVPSSSAPDPNRYRDIIVSEGRVEQPADGIPRLIDPSSMPALSMPLWLTKERFAAFLVILMLFSVICHRVARRKPTSAQDRQR